MFGSKSAIGVDIGSNSVKVVQLRRNGQHYGLEKFAVTPIYPDGQRPEDEYERRRAKVNAIRRALNEARISAKNAVSSVSGESIIVRYLQLPEMPVEELKKALQWEAEEYIPFRLDEVNIDSVVLGKNAVDGSRVDVLLVSAKKDLIEEHLSVIRQAGLNPKIVDVDSFAFVNCYEANYSQRGDECVALLNVGSRITNINICDGGVSRFSRDIELGGESITAGIQSKLKCSYGEAESKKITHGASLPESTQTETTRNFSTDLMDTIRGTVEQMTGAQQNEAEDQAEVVAKVIDGSLAELITEVRRSIEFFENQIRAQSVSRVILGGGCADMTNLKELLERELSLPVELLDPLRQVRPVGREADPAKLDAVRHALGVGIGLGLRGLMAA
jgi:type IV pilus assembly protein PilM